MTAALIGVSLASAGCSHLVARQREAIYRPTPGTPASFPGLRAGDEAWSVTLSSPEPVRLIGGQWLPAQAPQTLRMWWLPAAGTPGATATAADGPALLYLHGTFRNLYQNLPKIEALRANGFSVLAVDYRGWGSSTPVSPTEDSIVADARRAFAEFARRVPDARRRVLYGHSMGGGVAVALASELRHPTDYAALVLESTFTSLPDVAASAGWLGRLGAALTTERMDSLSRIADIQAPLLMLHGSADRTVPMALGRRLFDAAPGSDKQWVAIEGGSHSALQADDPLRYRQALHSLIARLPP